MAQQPSSRQFVRKASSDSAHRVVHLPTRFAAYAPSDPLTQSARRPVTDLRRRPRVRRHAIRQVIVLTVAHQLSDVVDELDTAIQLALADAPRGVVCDLSAMPDDAVPLAVEVLATAGRHIRDWPGIPVGVACPDPHVRETLGAHPLGRHLIVADSLFTAVSAVLSTPELAVEWLRVAPHPTAQRASRDFVSRILRGRQLSRVIPFATLVVSELVASSSVNAGTDIDLSVAWNLGALRLTVRDNGPGLSGQRHSALDLHSRGLTVVAGLSRAYGVLPTVNGGKVVWAVLDAPLASPTTSHPSAR